MCLSITKLLLLTILLLPLPLSASHFVGEPELERSQVWLECCRRADCEVTPFTTLRITPTHTLTETADGTAWIDKDKFTSEQAVLHENHAVW